jgi:protein-tyrosine phosphatase
LIPNGDTLRNYVDIHTHILPGLDDGPEEADESLKMLEGLEGLGFSHVFGTPHHRLYSWEGLDPATVDQATENMREKVSARGMELKLYPGMEFDLDENLAERSRTRPGASGPLLVDIGFWGVPRDLGGLFKALQGTGPMVCLVHPERNDELCRDLVELADLVATGIRLVGNLGSLSGMYGQQVCERAREVLDQQLYWAFASDLHAHDQLVWIDKGIEELGTVAGLAAVKRFLSENPMEAVSSMEDYL